ncbi:Hint domain-containing protein [Paracoccus alkanivorans]|uniref:Hedgehog/Intein (Hint) domain-containing protein n=1 Tax=Paracoccus alkanivorans TaxID=2116655 RepID=A0A3M0MFF0_9RHOB|nr:Hint domain-containing protein [Paracoccus alkanivorans]RMC36406.1 hypothetical protein C9E81_06995 [Paracoccus alkanivorans]
MVTRTYGTWGWVIDIPNNSGNDLENISPHTYKIGSGAVYRDDLAFRDTSANETDRPWIGDTDNDGGSPPGADEGVLVDGKFSQINEIARYNVEIELQKPGGKPEVLEYRFFIMQLDSDGANPGMTFIRPRDDDIQDMLSKGYKQTDVNSIRLVSKSTPSGSSEYGTLYADSFDQPFCYVEGTEILTKAGAQRVESLAPGDLVLTRDNGYQPVRWIGHRSLNAEQLAANPKLRPIRIRAGALGENTPSTDLLVSRQHRILIRSRIAQRMFGTSEVLVAAVQLLSFEGCEIVDDLDEVVYCHLLFDRHEIVIANGAEAESLFTGPEALKRVGPEAVAEIYALFPELRDHDYTPVAARPFPTYRDARSLLHRHDKSITQLVSA